MSLFLKKNSKAGAFWRIQQNVLEKVLYRTLTNSFFNLSIHGFGDFRATFCSHSSNTRQLQCVYVNKPLQKVFEKCLYCIYLFKLHDTSIIMLLINDVTNICGEISKIQLILLMAYTCNLKGLQEGEKMDRQLIYFASLTKIIRNENIVVDHSDKFTAVQLIVNPPLMGCNTENRAALQELPEKSPISGKTKRKLLLQNEKKQREKLKKF